MIKKYYLHMGLHKTGTKFFQHKVFPNLPDSHIYNPPRLTQLICDLIKAEQKDVKLVVTEIEKEKQLIDTFDGEMVVISREIMSGDLLTFYKNTDYIVDRLYLCFSNAHIICSFRYQVDWLLSCYRESVHLHHYHSISEFIGSEKASDKRFASTDYKVLDYGKIIRKLVSSFGKNNVNFFFYETLKKDKTEAVKEIATVLGLSKIKIIHDQDKVPNRGYSAFSITLSLFRFKVLKRLGLAGLFVHRPIFLYGEKGIPAGYKDLSVLPKKRYWENGFLNDNEEIRSKNYPVLSFAEKIKYEFSWRNFIKNRLDKMLYWDFDLLGENRDQIDRYFKSKNKLVFSEFKSLFFGEIPNKYL